MLFRTVLYDIWKVFFDTSPASACQEWDLLDAPYDEMNADQAKSFASRQRDLLSALTDVERLNLSRVADSQRVGRINEIMHPNGLIGNLPHGKDSSDEEGDVEESEVDDDI